MSKLTDAADAIRQYVAQHQAIIDLGEIVGEIGSVEQARDEAISARDVARGELADVQAQLAAAQEELAVARRSAENQLNNADTDAKKVIADAREEAENIVNAGRADAQNLKDVAARDIAATRSQALQNLDTINSNVAAKRQELIDLNVKIDTAKTTLASAQDALAEVKQNAQKILG